MQGSAVHVLQNETNKQERCELGGVCSAACSPIDCKCLILQEGLPLTTRQPPASGRLYSCARKLAISPGLQTRHPEVTCSNAATARPHPCAVARPTEGPNSMARAPVYRPLVRRSIVAALAAPVLKLERHLREQVGASGTTGCKCSCAGHCVQTLLLMCSVSRATHTHPRQFSRSCWESKMMCCARRFFAALIASSEPLSVRITPTFEKSTPG